jgi:hypothetical protein
MNVSTINVSADEARLKLDLYRNSVRRKRIAEDIHLERAYRAIARGARVIDVATAFRETGLNEKGQPKLAIARADWSTVYARQTPNVKGHWSEQTIGFTDDRWWAPARTAKNIVLPDNTFEWPRNGPSFGGSSPVPHMPPDVRPKFNLSNYHILFEVKEWQTYPVDPFLMRRIHGHLYIIHAEWELTELEAALLSGLRGN